MNNFVVDVCSYDASSSDPNPICWLHGFCNGVSSGYWAVYWGGIQQALNSGGVSALQAFLGPILLGVFGPPFPRGPVFSAPFSPPPPANVNNKSVSAPEAIGSWTA
jgi:hypothetical protein